MKKAEEDYQTQLKAASGLLKVSWQCHSLQLSCQAHYQSAVQYFWHARSCWQRDLLISVVVAQERSMIAKKAEEDYQTQLKAESGLFKVSWQFHSL